MNLNISPYILTRRANLHLARLTWFEFQQHFTMKRIQLLFSRTCPSVRPSLYSHVY